MPHLHHETDPATSEVPPAARDAPAGCDLERGVDDHRRAIVDDVVHVQHDEGDDVRRVDLTVEAGGLQLRDVGPGAVAAVAGLYRPGRGLDVDHGEGQRLALHEGPHREGQAVVEAVHRGRGALVVQVEVLGPA